jgi:hypothetical protein
MKHHRKQCVLWQMRAAPMDLMIARRRKTRQSRSDEMRAFDRCPVCEKRSDHHEADCPNSACEAVRRESIAKHKIDPVLWETFLRLLAKKYEGRE